VSAIGTTRIGISGSAAPARMSESVVGCSK
jgi:hypothetical protein